MLALFLGLGGIAFLALNLAGGVGFGSKDPSDEGAARSPPEQAGGAVAQLGRGEARGEPTALGSGAGAARRSSGELDESPELPALRMLEWQGLTIGAEGIPKVELAGSSAHGSGPMSPGGLGSTGVSAQPEGDVASALAGQEACRFAYGVWELSPNQTFRFLSTCRGLGALELVGAYDVRDAKIVLSELRSGGARWSGVLDVERPSTMVTTVLSYRSGRPPLRLVVTQRVTVLRGGLHGEDFRSSFRRKNRLTLPEPPRADLPASAPRVGPSRPTVERGRLEALLGGSGDH